MRVKLSGGTAHRECTACRRYREVSTLTQEMVCADTDACRAYVDAEHAAQVEAVLIDVKIEPYDADGAFSVHPVWGGVDRPDTGGMVVRGMPLARRLERAIRAGKAYVPTGVRLDSNGRSYVATETRVLGRMLNADLRRLGF